MQKMVNIYSLTDPNSFQVRYIGKTKNELNLRLYSHLKEKHKCHRYYWLQKIKNTNQKPIIELVDIVPESEWVFWEKHYISLFKSWGFNLVNSTDGGEGLDGYKHSEKTKEKLRNINLGKKYSEETKAKLRNRKVSQITKEVIAKKLSLPIIQLTLNGKFICEWKSSREVTRQLDIKIGALSDCLNKKTKSCNDCIWIFKSEYNPSLDYSISKEKRYKRKVVQLSLEGKIVKVWNSIREVYLSLKIKDSNISLCCKGKRNVAGGFKWRYL